MDPGEDWRDVESPRVGHIPPDFELPTDDAQTIRLSDFRGHKHVVVEFASITCSVFSASAVPMQGLYTEFREKGFEFLTVYGEEAHPTTRYPGAESDEEKLQYARDCRVTEGLKTPLLIDDMQNTVQKTYGGMPNMVYVVHRDGRIVYKAAWTWPEQVRSVLDNLLQADGWAAQGVAVNRSYGERITFIAAEHTGRLGQLRRVLAPAEQVWYRLPLRMRRRLVRAMRALTSDLP